MESKRYDKLLKRENLKNTRHRISVLDVMAQNPQPISADAILLCLKDKGISISVSTVYRILDKLMEKGIVLKTGLTEERKGLYEISQSEHKHHLVCIKCKKMLPIGGCPFQEYEKDIENKFGFDITGHKIELFGFCRNCRSKESQ